MEAPQAKHPVDVGDLPVDRLPYQLRHGRRCWPADRQPPERPDEPSGLKVDQPTPALFRMMAEVAVLLSQPLPADELQLEPRG